MLGRLVHLSADAVIVSALLAGVKRSSGLSPDLNKLPNDTSKNVAEKYLGVGEFIFDSTVAAAHASQYFARANPTSVASLPAGIDRLEKPQPATTKSGWFS